MCNESCILLIYFHVRDIHFLARFCILSNFYYSLFLLHFCRSILFLVPSPGPRLAFAVCAVSAHLRYANMIIIRRLPFVVFTFLFRSAIHSVFVSS